MGKHYDFENGEELSDYLDYALLEESEPDFSLDCNGECNACDVFHDGDVPGCYTLCN